MSDNQHLENIQEIRSIMEKSTRFLSLSGLSGVMAGVSALLGAFIASYRINSFRNDFYTGSDNFEKLERDLFLIAIGVLVFAILFAFLFTSKKAKKAGEKIWNRTSKKILFNLSIPLLTGGFVVLFMIYHQLFVFIAPLTLIFYGLACINSSHQTVRDIFYLGLTCVLLGMMNLFFLGQGILFWSLGFGVAHILYGTLMYFKYDRKA
jgi:uncharacterized membrane protein YidH (DUF202 family)